MKMHKLKQEMAKKIAKSKESEQRESKIKQCANWVYINGVDWCVAMKGTHIHQMCMLEIFNNIDSRIGIPFSEYIDTLNPDWGDYWYDPKVHQHYNKQQLKRIEREFNNGKESEDLVYEMLQWVWFTMIPENMRYDDIDEVGIYKLRIRWCK